MGAVFSYSLPLHLRILPKFLFQSLMGAVFSYSEARRTKSKAKKCFNP